MYLCYSAIIDWVLNDATVDEDVALQALPDACRSLIRDTLQAGEPWKLSFGYSDDDGVCVADFTPRRGHPLCRNYEAWMISGDTPLEAIVRAKKLWEMRRDATIPDIQRGDAYD